MIITNADKYMNFKHLNCVYISPFCRPSCIHSRQTIDNNIIIMSTDK